MALLEARDLTVGYSEVPILRGVGLFLEPNEIVAVVGPNGAGKSTLLRILATIARPTTGRAVWNGIDLARAPDDLRRVLGYLPQDFGIYPHLSAEEFLHYPAAMRGIDAGSARRRIDGLLDLVNLSAVRRHRSAGSRAACASASGSRRPCSTIPRS